MSKHFKSLMSVLVCALMIISNVISSPSAQAAGPWYVAPTGNDSNSCLSVGSPCATINGAISKASSGDTIRVATGTYTGTGTEVVLIDKSINLSRGWNSGFTAQSGMSTIDGDAVNTGIFVNSGVSAFINYFAIQKGPCYGGIINFGVLTLAHSMVTNNGGCVGGAGITNESSAFLHISNTAVSDNNGNGINNIGTLILFDSSLHNNVGRGLYSSGTVTLTNSAVYSNLGGGFNNNNGGILSVLNSTISGNLGEGGVINDVNGILYISSSTINGNTGGLAGGITSLFATQMIQNSIVAGNTGYNGPGVDCYTNTGVISSTGYNLIGNTTGCVFSSTTGDLLNVNAKLWTSLVGSPRVHPLLVGSPAINAGNPSGCKDYLGNPLTTDQRGVARVGRCDIGAYEFDPNNNLIRQVFLPLVQTICKPGICGRVTLNGAPAADVFLELRFFNGSSWNTLATTNTNAEGYYAYPSMPSLAPGQRYYVRYRNLAGTPGRLWLWATRELTTYSAGTNFEIGNFDIADIALTAPGNGATVALPYAFQWTRRPATSSDTYEFNLFDPNDFDPYFFTDPPLGYVGGYTLNSLPPGFGAGAQYVWEVWVYSPEGGYGISYETRTVMFSNTGMSVGTLSAPTVLSPQRLRKHEIEERLKR